jgi:hypothetical protein
VHRPVATVHHHEIDLAPGELAENPFQIADLGGLGMERFGVVLEHCADSAQARAVAPAARVGDHADPVHLGAAANATGRDGGLDRPRA